jgi:enoyl-[acyl-carrier protein] reductase I
MVDYVAANSPLPEPVTTEEVGRVAAFLCSPLGSGITGSVLYVDKGYNTIGMAVDRGELLG